MEKVQLTPTLALLSTRYVAPAPIGQPNPEYCGYYRLEFEYEGQTGFSAIYSENQLEFGATRPYVVTSEADVASMHDAFDEDLRQLGSRVCVAACDQLRQDGVQRAWL